MAITEFKDLPDTSTPLNAENLNSMLKDIKNNSDMLANVNLIRPYYVSGGGDGNLIDNDTVIINNSYVDAINLNIAFNYLQLKANHNYILTIFFDGQISGGSYKVVYFKLKNDSSKTVGNLKNDGSISYKFTPSKDDTIERIILDISAGTNFENLKMKFMLYEGAEEKNEYIEHLAAFDSLDNTMFFFDETFSINKLYSYGIEKDSYVYIIIPLSKSTSNVSNFSILNGSLTLYNSDGQLCYSNQNIENITSENIQKTLEQYCLTIGIKIDNSFTQTIKNNTLVSANLENVSIRFNI